MSTDIRVANVADNNITEITNNLDNKNFSCISVLEDQILVLKNSLSEENAERLSLAIELKQLKKKYNKVNTELKIKTCRLAKLCPRNFNKRINRQKQINKELSSKIKLLPCAVSTLEKENVKLKKDLDIACIDKTKLSKSNSYLKTKINKVTENTTTNKNVAEPKLLELHDYIAFLENHEGVLEERVEELSSQKLSFFQNKKYTNKIRSVYEDLLCFGVSSRNVEKVVRIVLEKLAGITCDRLPKATFSKDMLYEARALAQFQVASELNCSDADFCLQSDGTSKKGHSYMTYDASKKSGEVFVLGLREVGSGDAQAQLDLLKEVAGNISDASSKSNFSDTFFASIKNLMSDCCYTHKKLINS